MYESELVDILVGISEGNYIVEQRQVQKGSKQAEERAQQKKELEALKKKIESKLAENSSLSQGKGR